MMKKIYSTLIVLLSTYAAFAQCSVTVQFSQSGNNVTVAASGTGAAQPTYVVDWGDGANSFSQNATHEFAEGIYTVCVTYLDAGNPFGCNDEECQLFIIGGSGCAVDFTPIVSGLTAAVNAQGAGGSNPVYSINWGDGSTSAGNVGNHVYAQAGTYTICVTYTTTECVAETCQTIELGGAGACTIQATFTITGNTVSVSAVGTGAVSPTYAISWDNGGLPVLASSGSNTYTQSGTYLVCAVYLDGTNPSGCNATQCEEINLIVGVDEMNGSVGGLNVYPNPASGLVTLEVDMIQPEYARVEVLNMLGELVNTVANQQLSQGKTQINWDSTALSSGIYFVRITAGNDSRTIKMIKE